MPPVLAVAAVTDLFMRQEVESLITDDRAAELQVAVQLRRFVCPENRLYCREDAWAACKYTTQTASARRQICPRRLRKKLPVPHEVRKDELEAAAIVLSEHEQSLCVAAQTALSRLDVQAHNAVVSDACGTCTARSQRRLQ